MGSFDLQPSTPGLLRSESLNITIKFNRISPTTGRVSWNIPTPALGCTADTQAYCGMLVVIDTTPTAADKLPTHGTVYSSDGSIDPNLFAGDRIGSSYVVAGLYQDRVTTSVDVSGLDPATTYYVSGFPTDCQQKYFLDGVHAYAPIYAMNATDGTNGNQVIFTNQQTMPTGVSEHDVTGLLAGEVYQFEIQIGLDPKPNRPLSLAECVLKAPTYTIEINGADAPTYGDLVVAINRQFATLQNAAQSTTPPNTNSYFLNVPQRKLFLWDGYTHNEVPTLVSTTQPNLVTTGTYWNNNGVLKVWDGSAWLAVTVVNTTYDPAVPQADSSYWFNGVLTRVWNGVTWCDTPTTISEIDPSNGTSPIQGSYWYQPTTGELYRWNSALGMWMNTPFIQYSSPPSSLPVGSMWFNEVNNTLYTLNTPLAGWNAAVNVAISENAPSTPADGKYWYAPSSQTLSQWSATTTSWTEVEVMVTSLDPLNVASCSTWWNTTTSVLSVWDSQTATWAPVTSFLQSQTDPTSQQTVQYGTTWFQPSTNTLSVYEGGCFVPVQFVFSLTDPTTSIQIGVVHYNGSVWSVRSATGWDSITPTSSPTDPTILPSGTFWLNPTTVGLSQWNGASWNTVSYTTQMLTPQKGALWFDLLTNTLFSWNGATWAKATPPATVELDCNGNLKFTDNLVGSSSYIGVRDLTLLSGLTLQSTINPPSPGTDGISGEPTYNEVGIGTDGSPAMRDQMAMDIRYELGYPVVDVEVTKEQMDYAITRALSELRQRSGIAYKRGFFFMGIKANEQKFLLTNKISKMNKIVDVMGVYRVTSSFLSSAHGAGVYGQIVMQHMYNMGTFDLLSYHLMGEYTKLLETLFAARITYTWNEQTRELYLHHKFPLSERMVAIEATVERTEQEIMSDRYAQPWIRRYAAAVCRLMLAETRGKFATLPGAGGSITLNASELRQAAREDMQMCLDEIDNYIADKPDEYGSGAHFVFG